MKTVNQEHVNHITAKLISMYHEGQIQSLEVLASAMANSLSLYLAATEVGSADVLPTVISAFDEAMATSEQVPHGNLH